MLRRQLLTSAAMLPVLAACAKAPVPVPPPAPAPAPVVPTPLPQTIAKYVNAVIVGLENAIPQLAPNFSTETYAQMIKWLAIAKQMAADLVAGLGAASTSGMIQQFVVVIQDILGALSSAGTKMPAWVPNVIAAVQVLLPLILAFAGVGLRRAAPSPAAVDHAVVVLHSVPRRSHS